jgi:glycerol-3-phosphate dehydrogenase (NAD(P)+)
MNAPRPEPVAVIGAGSWGTALAIQMARAGHATMLWGRDSANLALLRDARCNERYLPDAPFPAALLTEPDLRTAILRCDDVLITVPSHAFRATLELIRPFVRAASRVAWATKGFEAGSGLLPHQVALEVLGARPMAVLSGPTFASEVGAGLPTAMAIASRDEAIASDFAQRLAGPNFRVYTQADILGVEIGGAVKNVIAIGCGIADGMGFGANTRVALITRGLAEMMRLGSSMGADRDTFMGLAGLGDLVLTCTDDQSRNRRVGLAIGRGENFAMAEQNIHQVVEGVPAARAVHAVASKAGVDMPICTEVYRVIYEGKPTASAVAALMGRGKRSESD